MNDSPKKPGMIPGLGRRSSVFEYDAAQASGNLPNLKLA